MASVRTLAQAVHVIEEWRRAFGEAGNFGRPVVHLDVDIGVVIGAPGRAVGVIPESLQIRRKAAGPRRGYQQIASELEESGLELGIRLAGGVPDEPFVGGERAGFSVCRAEVQQHAIEESFVVDRYALCALCRKRRIQGCRPGLC